jgi:hypothetical protein
MPLRFDGLMGRIARASRLSGAIGNQNNVARDKKNKITSPFARLRRLRGRTAAKIK